MLPLLGLSLVLSIALCWHVVRTNQQTFWLWIILAFQPVGGLAYLVVIVLPGMLGGPTARKIGSGARAALDPTRDYRKAKADADLAPTPRNRMKLAEAAVALGRHAEAEQLYAEAATGIHADDPALLLGRAKALLELERPAEALTILQTLGQQQDAGRTPAAALAMARAYAAVDRTKEAVDAYRWALERLPGFEAPARYAAFLAGQGRLHEAKALVADMDERIQRVHGNFKSEGQAWRDLAARSLASAR